VTPSAGAVTRLRYGNTNTFYLAGGLLVDTDMAGTLPAFFRAIKSAGIALTDIPFAMATHYHPDHCGLLGELQGLGVRLLVLDVQLPYVHFADALFARSRGVRYTPPDERRAAVISAAESRAFLLQLGIRGEIAETPSHSADSVSLLLDGGDCLVGDLEPQQYLAAYEENGPLARDWARVMRGTPRRILFAHANEKRL